MSDVGTHARRSAGAVWASVLTFACSRPGLTDGSGQRTQGAGAAGVATTRVVETHDPSTTLQPGPPWGHAWCITEDAVWSDELARKHAAGAVRSTPTRDDCDVSFWFKGEGSWRLGVTAECGDAHLGKVPWYRRSFAAESRLDPELGVEALSRSVGEDTDSEASVDAWDSDVPCHVSITAMGADGPRRARALMKDVLTRLTPERIARPRAELVVGAEDTTPDRARAELGRYSDKVAIVQRYAPLQPGYPKVIQSSEFPGLPPGKHFLLFAICGSTRGEQLAHALSAAVPLPPKQAVEDISLRSYLVDGLGLQEACPPGLTADPTGLGANFKFHVLPDQRQLALGVIQSRDVAAPGSVHTRVAAFLYSKDLELLDSTVLESSVPPSRDARGRYASRSHVSYAACETTITRRLPAQVYFSCDALWNDLKCSVNPREGTLHTLEATSDGKIKVTIVPHTSEGRVCNPNEGPEAEE